MLAALVASLAACGEQAPTVSRDLLARQPDQVIEQPGALVPTADGTFGSYGFDGWLGRSPGTPAAEPIAWSSVPKARLRLPAIAPGVTGLRLRACAPPGSEGLDAAVQLNGHELGTLRLGPDLADFALETPRALWRRGDNVLELGSCP